MHRTQIYLQDDLYDKLKARAGTLRVSISELIRRTLEADIQKDPLAEARAFFDRLSPLASYSGVDAQAYVDDLRGKSRLLQRSDPACPGASWCSTPTWSATS